MSRKRWKSSTGAAKHAPRVRIETVAAKGAVGVHPFTCCSSLFPSVSYSRWKECTNGLHDVIPVIGPFCTHPSGLQQRHYLTTLKEAMQLNEDKEGERWGGGSKRRDGNRVKKGRKYAMKSAEPHLLAVKTSAEKIKTLNAAPPCPPPLPCAETLVRQKCPQFPSTQFQLLQQHFPLRSACHHQPSLRKLQHSLKNVP